MKKLLSKLVPILPILGIALTVLVLFFVNYKPGTILTGWDNLHPEFNLGLALKRSIFSVWQEYQSLGLLGGMGHAADLVHVCTIFLLSFILQTNVLRYAWTFLMLFAGGTGTYFLLNYVLSSKYHVSSRDTIDNTQYVIRNTNIPAFLGGMFYLLNLATLQAFYAPFEAFIAHFAGLPWVLLASLIFLKTQTKKTLLFLSTVLFLTTPQAYIPTLFVVYILALIVLISTMYITSEAKSKFIKSSAKLFGAITLINSFWLLPFLYFTFTSANVNVNSKINQMATELIFAQNKEFGTLPDVMLLKGFWFQTVDPNLAGNFTYMLAPLRTYYSNPVVIFIGFLLFTTVFLGFFRAIKNRDKLFYPFIALFIFSFTMLATATVPFSWFDIVFRKFPLFGQAFRFPFTKFSILAALSYSIFFAYGLVFLIEKLKKSIGAISKHAVAAIAIFFLIAFSLPAFSGNFFYQKETIAIPQEYFQVFDYFKKQDAGTRIADFPQHTFWGWNFYSWGYGGSGFLWYGIQQPILDRDFDPWSGTSEQYYFEISNALYTKNPTEFKNVLNKYQVRFLLVDTNIIYPPSPKALFYPELETMISKIPEITKDASFGNIGIYKVNITDKPKTFVYSAKNMTSVTPVQNQNTDVAYATFGNYYSNTNTSNINAYPFAQLFSKKSENELKVSVSEKEDAIEVSSVLPVHTDTKSLSIASFSATENIIPAMLSRNIDDKNITTITLTVVTPIVSIAGRKVYGDDIEFPIFVLPPGTAYPLAININGLRDFKVSNSTQAQNIIVSSFLTLDQDNSITLSSPDGFSKTYVVTASLLKSFNFTNKEVQIPPSGTPQTITVRTPKILDEYLNFVKNNFGDTKAAQCNDFRKGTSSSDVSSGTIVLSAKNTSNCITFSIPNLLHDQGYAIFVQGKNTAGRALHFWTLNEDEKNVPIDTYLENTNGTHAFVLPTMEANGRGYSLHFDNESIGRNSSVNSISRVALYHIPFNFLTNMTVTTPAAKKVQSMVTTEDFIGSVVHPNESLYIVRLKKPLDARETIVLSQSYNAGWAAYQVQNSESRIKNYLNIFFPFIFGAKLQNHVMVNNWSNGWNTAGTGETIIIVYLPQYLEYFGFVLLGGTFIFLTFKLLKPKRTL